MTRQLVSVSAWPDTLCERYRPVTQHTHWYGSVENDRHQTYEYRQVLASYAV